MANDNCMNAILQSVKRNKISTVKLLLEVGVDLGRRDRNGSTCLHLASSQGHFEIIKMILEDNAVKKMRMKKKKVMGASLMNLDINANDNNNNTPLMKAA